MSIITNSKCGRPATGQNVSSMPARDDHANGSGRTWFNMLQATCELANRWLAPLVSGEVCWRRRQGTGRGGLDVFGATRALGLRKDVDVLTHGRRQPSSNPSKLKLGPEIVRSRINKAQLMSPAVYDTTPSVRRARESIVMPRRGYRRSSTHRHLQDRPSGSRTWRWGCEGRSSTRHL